MFNNKLDFDKDGPVDRENATSSPLSESQLTQQAQQANNKLFHSDSHIESNTLDYVRPIYRKTNSHNSSKLAQLPQLETNITETTGKKIVNVNESLLETVKNTTANNNNINNCKSELLSTQSKTFPVPASILANSSYPTPTTPQLKTSNSTISFQVPNQKHRGSISARPSTTKVTLLDSPVSGIPSSRQPSIASTIQTPILSRQPSINSVNPATPHPHPHPPSQSQQSSQSHSNPLSFTVNPVTGQKVSNPALSAANISRKENIRSPYQIDPLSTMTTSIPTTTTTTTTATVTSISTSNLNMTNMSTVTNPVSVSSHSHSHLGLGFPSSTNPSPNNITHINQGTPITFEDAPMTPLNGPLTFAINSTSTSRKSSIQTPNEHLFEIKSGISSSSSINGCGNFGNQLQTPSSKKKILKTVVTPPIGPPVPFTQYLCKEDDDKIHILIGATGSVATIKIPMIIDKLFKIYGTDKVSIQLVVTEAAEHFLRGLKISTEVKIWREQEEWSAPVNKIKPGDPILHVELRKWADIFLIAPLSANTLAKIANGLADNLLTSILRIWNPAVPVLVAPAMNTFMYMHPITKIHLNIINCDLKFIEVLKPVEKVLVCGDIGMGGMREWSEVVDIIVKKLKIIQKKKLEEKLGREKTLKEKEEKLMMEENEMNQNTKKNEQEEDNEDEDEDEDDDEDDDDEDEDEDEDEDDEDEEEDDDDEDEDEGDGNIEDAEDEGNGKESTEIDCSKPGDL